MDSSSPALYHFLSGSFRSLSLFLLAFSPVHRNISHVQTIPAFGPHQYLATNQRKDRVFTTSWAEPPSLSSWTVERGDPWRVSHLNTVAITATSSYVSVPPPFTHIYSAGGPTGEVHVVDSRTGGFGIKSQEILFIPKDDLPQADKTRVALRYGAHGIESTSTPSHSLTFVPNLGTDTIEVYTRDPISSSLSYLSSSPSPRGPNAHDGPRHVKIHPNVKVVYCVTEHSNFVDLYEIAHPTLKYIASRSLLPDHLQSSSNTFRGDTLLLTPATASHPVPYALVTTTRGSTPATRGWLSIFALDENGYFIPESQTLNISGHPAETVVRYETPTSGGKANAIDLLPKHKLPLDKSPGSDFSADAQVHLNPAIGNLNKTNEGVEEEGLWILLTDDDERIAGSPDSSTAGVKVLEWDGWRSEGVRLVAEWPEMDDNVSGREGEASGGERMMGGSHAIWLV